MPDMNLVEYNVSDGICFLRLNAPPVNAITVALLDGLRAAVERANADAGVRDIVVTGDTNHFSAGADVNLFREVASAEDAIRLSRVFQDALSDIEDSTKPVVAAVAGKMMGSAVELAAACHLRVCVRGARFSMPEINLGINPGAGGTQRLPRLIGALPALKMMLTAETVGAEDALALGLVDAVCDSEELLDRTRALLDSAGGMQKTRDRTDKVCDLAATGEAFAAAQGLKARVHPEIIAPSVIAEAVRLGLSESFEAGQRKEREGFAACMDTPAAQNKIRLFFAVRETAGIPGVDLSGSPAIERAAVVGMGTMGTGIAHALIIAGVPVVVRDEQEAPLQKGVARIRSSVDKRVEQGKCSRNKADGMLRLLETTTAWEDIADADLVIEAVFEDVATKRGAIAAIEQRCRSDAIVASNTSTLSLDTLAEGMQHPERLVGLHFFIPAQRMPLVEVVRMAATPPAVAAAALKFVKTIRKTPVLVNNSQGFVVNRLVIPYLAESFRLLEDGADPMFVDEAMVGFGFPMGPFALTDMAGVDILATTASILSDAFPRHGRLSSIALALVDGGHLGQKTGSGVYRYEQGSRRPLASASTEAIVEEARRQAGIVTCDVGEDEIIGRLVLGMVNEASYVMAEGIVQRESDIDVASVLGMGFPDFRGGVLGYARDLGFDEVRSRLEALAEKHGERFSPCGLLKNKEGVG